MKDIKRKPTATIPNIEESKRITLRIDSLLLTQTKNLLQAQWASNNYQHGNLSSLIRQALINYQQRKLKLVELTRQGTKTEISLKLDANLITFYRSWPDRKRSEILNKVLQGYLEEIGKKVIN